MARRHFYGRQGHVFFRFNTSRDRDAWVAEGTAKEPRIAVVGEKVPRWLRFGRYDPDFELREGPPAKRSR